MSLDPFNQPSQIDLLGQPDTRTDFVAAFRAAECDARELKWISEAHLIAYGAGRYDDCTKLIVRSRAIKGTTTSACPARSRVNRYGRSYPRGAFATGFTTW